MKFCLDNQVILFKVSSKDNIGFDKVRNFFQNRASKFPSRNLPARRSLGPSKLPGRWLVAGGKIF